MTKLFFHTIKVILFALSLGLIGSHYLLQPVPKAGYVTSLAVIGVIILSELIWSSNQTRPADDTT